MKPVVLKEILRLENSIKKREGIEVKKFNNEMLSKYINYLVEEKTPLAKEAPYANYEAWTADVTSIDAKLEKQLDKIDDNVEILRILKTYVSEHAADEEESAEETK